MYPLCMPPPCKLCAHPTRHLCIYLFVQAIIALPPGVDAGERDRYSLRFFLQGPQLGSSSDDEGTPGARQRGARSGGGGGGGGRGGATVNAGNGAQRSAAARWQPPLADDGVPADLRELCKVDGPPMRDGVRDQDAACYSLRWPGGWKLQDGVITKFATVTKPPVLLCSDIDGTMHNEHPDVKTQFWMDCRTQEFQDYWESSAALARSVLVYNTGRSKGQLVWLLKEKPALAVPDVLITAVGTKVGTALLLLLLLC